MLLARSLLFYAGLVLSTIIAVPVLLIIYPLPFRLRYFAVTRWTVFNLWWLRITCNLKHNLSGKENIPEANKTDADPEQYAMKRQIENYLPTKQPKNP